MLRTYDAATVRAAEEPLLAAGEPLMARAARALANAIIWELRRRSIRVSGTRIAIFAGAGNNGGDALYAGAYLARRGAAVVAVAPLAAYHREGAAALERAGGSLIREASAAQAVGVARRSAVWVDGLLGIGARGAAREPLASVLRALETERLASPVEPLVVAVDTPSGIGVDDGALPGPYLSAHLTVTMGAAKAGLVLEPARRAAGRVDVVELGFGPYLGEPAVLQLGDADVADLWRVPGADDHKYTRGVVGVVAGSVQYPGAGLLTTTAALAAGPGMVRYLGESAVAELVIAEHPEVVAAAGQIQALTVGSGDPPGAPALLRAALKDESPVVVDAGALPELGHMVWREGKELGEHVVLTPHAGEAATLAAQLDLRSADGTPFSRAVIESCPVAAARALAARMGATVVLKGAVDVVASPSGPCYAQGGAPGWRAVAGAGDVLAGLIGALLAQHVGSEQHAGFAQHAEPTGAAPDGPGAAPDGPGASALAPGAAARIAAAALHVHARAAALAAGTPFGAVGASALGEAAPLPGRPITAAQIAARIPEVIGQILAGGA
ncbi:NAD(P)H-hydrate dehydratase [Actinotignum sanguinis]|uniref:Multifunctional fusion protein n=2 Tax=Actinotignum sanguinis TaxID=1445614 RepID=A0ABT5V6V7_9ACTO|nr:NAD(P)H-hydrate dehydratase [Actinotignum sanguinis]MDE1656315.1 NAD(P)H-hydrate dehydratase [Actinotignum sanguinis]